MRILLEHQMVSSSENNKQIYSDYDIYLDINLASYFFLILPVVLI